MKFLTWIIIIALIIWGIFYFVGKNDDGQMMDDEMMEGEEAMMDEGDVMGDDTSMTDTEDEMTDMSDTEENVVLYTENGYEPKELTISVGDTVTFRDQGTGNMWTATAMHPTHSVYNEAHNTDMCDENRGGEDIFDQCEVGDEFVFMFNQAGEWAYHNHAQAAHFGKIIVQ